MQFRYSVGGQTKFSSKHSCCVHSSQFVLLQLRQVPLLSFGVIWGSLLEGNSFSSLFGSGTISCSGASSASLSAENKSLNHTNIFENKLSLFWFTFVSSTLVAVAG